MTLNDTIHELARALVTTWVNMLSCFPRMGHWAYYGIFGPEMDHAQNGQWARLLEPIMANHGYWSNMMFCKSLATRYKYNILQQQNLVSPGSCQLNCSDWQCQFCHQVVSSHTPKQSCTRVFFVTSLEAMAPVDPCFDFFMAYQCATWSSTGIDEGHVLCLLPSRKATIGIQQCPQVPQNLRVMQVAKTSQSSKTKSILRGSGIHTQNSNPQLDFDLQQPPQEAKDGKS